MHIRVIANATMKNKPVPVQIAKPSSGKYSQKKN
jgi:hypothetical protein